MQKQAEVSPLCQGRLCKNFTIKTLAVKVCHHRDCQSANNGSPLLVCLDCDRVTHAGNLKNHARFDLKGNEGFEKMSSSKIAESDSGAEDDQEPIAPVYLEKVKPKGQSARRRFMKLPTDNSKKKPRRHNTDDPGRDFIRLKVYVGTSGDFNLEMIPALKGKTLKESLEPILEKYNITVDSHSVFLDSSNTPLPLAFETFPLSGSILHVRDNSQVDKRVIDISKNFESKSQPEQPVSRTPSFNKRNQKEEKDKDKEGTGKEEEKESEDSNKKGRKNGSSFYGDNDDRNQGGQSGKPPGILTGLFTGNPTVIVKGKELPTVRSLPEILQYFTVHGLESETRTPPANNEQEFYLEDSWTKVVDNAEQLDKKDRDRQEAIWELLSTEVAYINKLQVIKKIFILCLRNIQSEGYLQELDLRNLFSNIEEIYAVNVSFWLRSLKSVVNMARHTKKLLDPFFMADGFSLFDSQFEPYVKYCMEESSCLKFLKQKRAEDELFKLYVEWCESRPECKRLKLSDLLVKPMQRVTKYPLLLKAILKKTVDEDKRKELISMIETVEKFVGKVNASMKIRHEKEKLNRTATKIESYWPVDPVTDEVEKCLVDNYCDFDLCRPMPGAPRDQHRCVLYEGALRLTEKQGRMDIYAFLFTDMLLLTKAKKMDKFKIVKAPLRIDKVKVHDLKDPGNFLVVYLNEYRTVVQAYVFQASQNVKEKWTQMIDKAKNLYQAVLQSDGSKCLTADDAGLQSPATTPNGSPTLKQKRNSWKVSSESLDHGSSGVPMVTVTSSSSSPKLRRHLSGSDGNLSLVGISDDSRSAIVRRASCNERKSKTKHEHPQRRPRADSKVTRSTSDPHNKPVRQNASSSSSLSRSSSAPKTPKPIPEQDLQLLVESTVDPDSPRSTTSPSEIDLTESVDVDEIQMSLSPDTETPASSPATEVSKSVEVGSSSSVHLSESPRPSSALSSGSTRPSPVHPSESTRPSSDMSRDSGRESSEKLKLLLAQKISNRSSTSSSKDSAKDDELLNSHESTKRVPRNHSDRKRVPRSSSVDRARRSGEHRSTLSPGSSADSAQQASSPLEAKSADGRKAKLTRSSSSGSRQLPDPSQITGKANRTLPKTQTSDSPVSTEERGSGKTPNSCSEMHRGSSSSSGLTVNTTDTTSGLQVSHDLADPLETRAPGGSVGSQAPYIKAPLITGLALSKNGSNGTDRKRTQLPKRSSPVMYRKTHAESAVRKSMDEQLLEPKSSPPLRRSKSEADSPVETLRTKSKNSELSALSKNRGGMHSKNSEGIHSDVSEGFHSKNSEGTLLKSRSGNASEERERTRSRPRRSSIDSVSTKLTAGRDEVNSDSKKPHHSSQECVLSNSHTGLNSQNSQSSQEQGSGGTSEKPRRQIKKYRGRESRKLAESDGKGNRAENVNHRLENLKHVMEPLMLDSSEYV